MSEVKSDISGSLVPLTKLQAMVMLEAAYLWMDLAAIVSAAATKAPAGVAPAPSDGPDYPALEGFIEQSSAEELAALYKPVRDALGELKGPRAELSKKAIKAVERTEELLNHLFSVRQGIEAQRSKGAAPARQPLDMSFDAPRQLLGGAAALMPKTEVPQIALGTLEFNLGHFDKALQAFRNAQRLNPKASLPRAHCGEALLFMGKVAEAEKELKAALELEPGSAGAEFAMNLQKAKEEGALPPPKARKK